MNLANVIRRRSNDLVDAIDGLWDRVGARLRTRPLTCDALLAGSIVTYFAVNVARTSLDAGIAKIHPAGVSGVSTNSLHDGRGAIRHAFEVWAGGYDRLGTLLGHRPVTLAIAQTALELALVPLSFLVFYGIVKSVRERVSAASPIHTLLRVSTLGVIAYVVLGLLNQLAELAILLRQRTIPTLDGALHLSGHVRTWLLPLFMIPLVVGLIQLERQRAPEHRFAWWRGTGTTYRVLIFVTVLHAALLLFSIPGAQSEDALRLWLRSPSIALAGLGATSLLSLSLATIAMRLGTDANPRRVLLGRPGTQRLAVLGAVLLLIGGVARLGPLALHRQPWGTGVMSVGILTLVVALLSLPLTPRGTPWMAPAANDRSDGPTPADPIGTSDGGGPTPATAIVQPSHRAKHLVPAVLALAPLTTVALSLIRASLPSIMGRNSSGWLIVYSVAAQLLAVVGFCLARAVAVWAFAESTSAGARRRLFIGIEIVLVTICAVVYALAIRDPWRFGPDLGVAAIVASFLTALVLVFGTVGYLMESRKIPAALDFVGFRRLPVIFGLVAIGFLSHTFAPRGYHDLATQSATLPADAQETVQSAFHRWLTTNAGDAAATASPPADRPAVPMVFVAAAGGGIKAAAFTSAALDCLFVGTTETAASTGSAAAPAAPQHPCSSADAWDRLFAASGASGGSVGIASVLAERNEGVVADDWIAERLGRDLLSPELAWQLFVEVPNSFVRFDPALDRAEVLQESWRRGFRDRTADPAGASFYRPAPAASADWTDPVVFLSGTNLNDGCRVNISSVRSAGHDDSGASVTPPGATRHGPCKDQRVVERGTAPDQAGTRDLTDYLCGQNIDLATAAFLSARFPAVSPTGTIRCKDADPDTIDSLSIGDGGYRDNSGAGSIMDTWGVLEPLVAEFNARHDRCIVPIFVEINNGYSGVGGPSPSSDIAQLLAPALGAAKVFSDLSYGPIEQAAAEFSRPMAPGITATENGVPLPTRFFRVSLVDHPGVTAPLGWSLSGAAVGDLVGQLDLAENRDTLDALQSLLDAPPGAAGLACRANGG